MKLSSLGLYLRRLPRWFFLLLILGYYFLFFCKYTILTASDLGRHIMNGKVIWESGSVFSTNYYSYTFPDRYVPNHHWLFGVISYALFKLGGFSLLTIMSAVLYTTAADLILWHTTKQYGKKIGLLTALVALPLITVRSETRPEAFSLFFFAIQLITLLYWQKNKISNLLTGVLLGVTTLLWVNIHIFFFFSFAVVGAFGLEALLNKDWQKVKNLIIFAIVCLIASLINPLGIKGALYPFAILGEYNYRVAENQSTFFYLQYHPQPIYYYILILSVMIFVGFLILFCKRKYKEHTGSIAITSLFIIFALITNRMIRFENFFGLVVILFLGTLFYENKMYLKEKINKIKNHALFTSAVSLIIFIVGTFVVGSGLYFPFSNTTGLGLPPGMQNSGIFYKQLALKGAMFNDFDIGSYAIFHLFPDQKVFVDNRAEAYPGTFLENYQNALGDMVIWQKLDNQYHFQSIYFSRTDMANYAQDFLVNAFKSNEWTLIYIDNFAIIFVRNTPENAAIIQKYQIPKDSIKIIQ